MYFGHDNDVNRVWPRTKAVSELITYKIDAPSVILFMASRTQSLGAQHNLVVA
jgi:hypothetical protein